MKKHLAAALAALLLLAPTAGAEQSVALGLRSTNGSDDAELYYRAVRDAPLLGRLRPVAGAAVTSAGAAWAGAGLLMRIGGEQGGYLQASVMPGLYARGEGPDLGHPVEFRSGIELGYRWPSGMRLGLYADHISNAGLGDENPGSDALGLRVTLPLR